MEWMALSRTNAAKYYGCRFACRDGEVGVWIDSRFFLGKFEEERVACNEMVKKQREESAQKEKEEKGTQHTRHSTH